MNILDIIHLFACIFYSLIGITFLSLFCLLFCGPYDYEDDYESDSNINIMSDTYQGNNRVFPRFRRGNSEI
jgi:hypothetical protein